MIEISGVSHQYEGQSGRPPHVTLTEISLKIESGTFVSFLGPSGCGKTTLLRIANGLIQPTDGEVRIEGKTVIGPASDRAMVFQEFNLLPWRTALGNVELPHELIGTDKTMRTRTALETLDLVGLKNFAGFYPHQLSGGMKQRVGLARALSISPSYLFMDEPFGALDPQIREVMQVELLKIWDQDRKTVVFVTHSVDEAIFLSDRIVVFSAHPGRVIADIHVELPRPRWRDEESIKTSRRFIEYRAEIWKMLKEQLKLTTQ
jgi:NitT/TauT family transport system ATP-binding protein